MATLHAARGAVSPMAQDRERARRNVVLALVHVAIVLAILFAFVWMQGHK